MRLEIGSGDQPGSGYDLHVDVLPLDGIDVVCRMEQLPFAAGSFSGLRANHVLEHQSWQLVADTVGEWARVLAPGADVDIGVPDARCRAGMWLAGEITTREANYWILGGHSDREAHKGADERGVPRWIWNAHHTLFDPQSLRDVLERCGLVVLALEPEDVCNLRAHATWVANEGLGQNESEDRLHDRE